ncbi:hypothetical protein ABZV77_27470 [Streptomyces sp. NPDC004732]|uniref:hypothetical protein n=1 Tax=Streptomyces sp. NPDC004732 TaxID=3154290 RepID=UPI0033AC4EB8
MTLMETPPEERQAQQVYEGLLAHFDNCTPCRVENYCTLGERLRRAHRATRSALSGTAAATGTTSPPREEPTGKGERGPANGAGRGPSPPGAQYSISG